MPDYSDNGLAHCLLSTVMFVGGSNFGLGFFDLGIIYDLFPATLGALNAFGLVFCVGLYVKGRVAPCGTGLPPDAGCSGAGFIFDYYWGMELYPRIFGVDVKKFVNCRFSMSYWQLAGISFAYRSYTLHGQLDPAIVLVALSQYIYLVKFFYWEIGYMRSIDIIVDRAGFYETWGCFTFVPAVYTLHTRMLVRSPSGLSTESAVAIFAIGLAGVLLNFWADNQRQVFRELDGKGLVWGEKPRFVRAQYRVVDAATCREETRTSLLLASGWWGIARHLQYAFELMAAWSWGLLGAGGTSIPNGVARSSTRLS
jgi:7-dehydrocholesterol reductase